MISVLIIIENLSKENHHVHGIKFSRNYGKSQALHAAFEKVQGDVVITMDADLQDDSTEIEPLYKMLIDGNYDLVSGWKKKRFDPITKTIPSKFHYDLKGSKYFEKITKVNKESIEKITSEKKQAIESMHWIIMAEAGEIETEKPAEAVEGEEAKSGASKCPFSGALAEMGIDITKMSKDEAMEKMGDMSKLFPGHSDS